MFDPNLVVEYVQEFSTIYPTHSVKVKPHFYRGMFEGYRVFFDNQDKDFGDMVISPERMKEAIGDFRKGR